MKELGAEVIDSDQLARKLMEPGTPGFSETVKLFGTGILKADGTLDRAKLAAIVFSNREALLKLNRVIHPRVEKAIEELLQDYARKDIKAVFVEMAVLLPATFTNRVDNIWVIKAPKEVIIERLKGRGISEKDALSRMANQPQVEEQIKDKLIIIMNTGDKNGLRATLHKMWDELQTEI